MNSWQQTIISIGQLIFAVALIPTILAMDKPAGSTSLLNTVVLIFFTFTFAYSRMWFPVITSALGALCWGTLLVQVLVK